MKFGLVGALAAASMIFGAALANAHDSAGHGVKRTDEELIKILNKAAPPAIVKNATIMNTGEDGKMKVIQEGTNGWTCMDPGNHGNGEPMCADPHAMEWAKAWQNKQPPPKTIGFMYMMAGDSGVSNTDPYNKDPAPTETNDWVQTGPHVMIVGTDAKPMMDAYPKNAKADPSVPYVMWPGTPYEHLMLPVN